MMPQGGFEADLERRIRLQVVAGPRCEPATWRHSSTRREGDLKSRFSSSLQVPAVLESCGLAAHREVQRASDFAAKGTGREPPGDAF